MSTTVIPVTTPTGGYEVHSGRGILESIPSLIPDRVRRVVIVHQPSLREVADEVRTAIVDSGREKPSPPRSPTAKRPRPPRSPASCGECADRPRSAAATSWWGSAAAPRPTWPASWPPPGCAASTCCRFPPRSPRWWTQPWAARPGSTPPRARTSSAPSTRRSPSWPTWTCSRASARMMSPPASPRWSRADSSPMSGSSRSSRRTRRPCSTCPPMPSGRSSNARSGSRPRWSPRTSPSRATARSSMTATRSPTPSSATSAISGAMERPCRSA